MALTPDELYASPEVDTVLNLTIPAAHEEVALAALAGGKNVYGEKPLAASLDGLAGRWMLRPPPASARRLRARHGARHRRADRASRGRGRAHRAPRLRRRRLLASRGHESWHPHPDFYYRDGGGPLLDMGPYYLTALVQVLGPVRWVHRARAVARATPA